ncbi:hypothetical protein, partial [Vibrio atlanticus]
RSCLVNKRMMTTTLKNAVTKDVRELIRYYFELQQAVKSDMPKWGDIAKAAQLPLEGRVI